MPLRNIHRAAVTSIVASAIAVGPALDAGPGRCAIGAIPVTRRRGVSLASPYRRRQAARAALETNPRDIARIIELGAAQSGVRQFREAIGLQLYRGETGPDDVLTSADKEDVPVATLAYGLGHWYLLRDDKTKARAWFERSVQSGGWPGFGFIVSRLSCDGFVETSPTPRKAWASSDARVRARRAVGLS